MLLAEIATFEALVAFVAFVALVAVPTVMPAGSTYAGAVPLEARRYPLAPTVS